MDILVRVGILMRVDMNMHVGLWMHDQHSPYTFR